MSEFTITATLSLEVQLTRVVYAEDEAGAKLQVYNDMVSSEWGPKDGGKDKSLTILGPDSLDDDDLETVEVV